MSSITKRGMFGAFGFLLSILIIFSAAYFGFFEKNKVSGFVYADSIEEIDDYLEAAQDFLFISKNSAQELFDSHKHYAWDYLSEELPGDGYVGMLNSIENQFNIANSALLQAIDKEEIKLILVDYITAVLNKSSGIGTGPFSRWDRERLKLSENWQQQLVEIEQVITGWAKVFPVYALNVAKSLNEQNPLDIYKAEIVGQIAAQEQAYIQILSTFVLSAQINYLNQIDIAISEIESQINAADSIQSVGAVFFLVF